MKKIPFILILWAVLSGIVRTEARAYISTDSIKTRPTVEAIRITNPIVVDGILSEAEWQHPGVSYFTQRDPAEGAEPTQKTEVWVAYNDEAIYIGARLFDTHPDSIVSRIGRRDADLSADGFYVGIDSYHDRRTGFWFVVYAGGSVKDGTMYNDTWDDNSWDGVWDAATRIDDRGWTLEMRIPYSQLRFPSQEKYTWGINFIRQIDRNKERDDFVMVPKKESGWVSRFADLTGMHDIHPPRRLEILPYTATTGKFLRHDAGDPFNNGHMVDQSFGTDMKVGIGSNLTLNATINPDFGQVEVDPAVVNLTQFETYFDEKRPFFIDGSNFFDFGFGGANSNWGFNWGTPTFFYSRRIGRPPQLGVQESGYSDIPDRTHIIGAGKFTGKISDGWSIGALQAFTAREYGKVDSSGVRFADVVEPFTYYGVLRTLREFNDGRQAVGFLGTATMRDLNHDYLENSLNRRAYALAADGWTNLDADQVWALTGWLASSRLEGTKTQILRMQEDPEHYYQRPDADYLHLDSNATSLGGYGGRIALNKQKGNTYLNAAFGFISPGMDLNDLGYMYRTDILNGHLVLGYNWYQPDEIFRTKWINLATFRSYSFGGRKIGEGYFMFYGAEFLNYWDISGNVSYEPAVYDPISTRGGPVMMKTPSYDVYFSGNTDIHKPVTFNFGFTGGRSESGGYITTWDPGIVWRPTSALNLTFAPEVNHDVTIAQWVANQADPTAKATYGSRYIFGKLDLREVSASIRMDYTFTPRLTFQLYLQPLISVGKYTEFKELKQPGTYAFNRYGIDNGSSISFNAATDSFQVTPNSTGSPLFGFANPDFNYKSLRGTAVLRWEYLPGSTIYLVWTQQRNNYDDPGDFSFSRDFGHLINNPGDNVFIMKITYWWNP